MTAPLARVGDVIEHGQDIPGNVRTVADAQGDVHRRHGDSDLWGMNERAGDNGEDEDSEDHVPWTSGHISGYGPLTVVEVDPEPQPAECSLCRAEPGETHNAFCPTLRPLRLKGTATGDNQLDVPQRVECPGDGCNGCSVCWAPGAGPTETVTASAPLRERDELRAKLAESELAAADLHSRMLAQADRAIAAEAEVKRLSARLDEATEALTERKPAESGPVVLSLPQVPDGAVALIFRQDPADPIRFTRVEGALPWRMVDDAGAAHYWALIDLLAHYGPVEVVMREPRTWPKLDPAPDIDDLPRLVDVEGRGRWSRLATHHFYPEADPNGAPLTLAGLRELGEVREVLT